MKKVAFFLLFLFLSCTVLNAAREYCKYAYQEDRAIPLILNYGIRLGVVGCWGCECTCTGRKYLQFKN
ncbi:putative lipoprotein [Campylobacter coli LMG 23344]|nr:putative lipoprotein [Campylobacter coli LMG 23344]EIB06713.1 putative lipoprotein [Campylobacter coli H6]KRS73701.1 hypothetical protein DB01_02560 [Campylobacter coli]